jgi:hypothetical protein
MARSAPVGAARDRGFDEYRNWHWSDVFVPPDKAGEVDALRSGAKQHLGACRSAELLTLIVLASGAATATRAMRVDPLPALRKD